MPPQAIYAILAVIGAWIFREPIKNAVAGTSEPSNGKAKPSGNFRKDNKAEIRRLAKKLEDAGIWGPGFADYLTLVAYTESRWNNNAGTDGADNRARGLFGFRPVSAWDKPLGEITAAQIKAVKDIPWSIVHASNYARRLHRYVKAGQSMDYMALRRGWAFPRLVKDTGNKERPELVKRWEQARRAIGLPKSFGAKKANLRKTDYPTTEELARLVGADLDLL